MMHYRARLIAKFMQFQKLLQWTMKPRIILYIIYDDQIDKNVGKYVTEKDLTHTEREFVFFNRDSIKFLRRAPKILDD
jgi:hypothetical protein